MKYNVALMKCFDDICISNALEESHRLVLRIFSGIFSSSFNWHKHNNESFLVLYRYSTLMRFFQHFCALLSTLWNERAHCTLMAMIKTRVNVKDDVEMKYSLVLTPYSLNYVLNF